MSTKRDAERAVRTAKARLGLSWEQIAEAVGRPVAWTVSALLGQQPMTGKEAAAAASLLDLAVPGPAGDRVVVTLDGKFLPYQWE